MLARNKISFKSIQRLQGFVQMFEIEVLIGNLNGSPPGLVDIDVFHREVANLHGLPGHRSFENRKIHAARQFALAKRPHRLAIDRQAVFSRIQASNAQVAPD